MKKPLIGLVASHTAHSGQNSISETYTDAVYRAGGIPVLLPPTINPQDLTPLRDCLDGIILPGGGDIDPLIFAGRPHSSVYGIDPARDRIEIALARLASQTGWPLLGICRGIQVINVALGGTLYTDIAAQFPTTLRHDCYPDLPRDHIAHTVDVQPGSHLAEISGHGKLEVNSLHHQGLERIGGALTVTSKSTDGLPEAVELAGHPFFIGIQWHPESLPDAPQHQAIFSALIQAAALK
jgi:putative glutamine amidotransferase